MHFLIARYLISRNLAVMLGVNLTRLKKTWDDNLVKIALAFPDIYDIGLSNLGLTILYDIINKREDALAERVYAPWTDMEDAMRKIGNPPFFTGKQKASKGISI